MVSLASGVGLEVKKMLPHLLLVKGAVMGDDIPPFLPAPLGAWAKHGLCVNADDPDAFYPEDGSRGTRARRSVNARSRPSA